MDGGARDTGVTVGGRRRALGASHDVTPVAHVLVPLEGCLSCTQQSLRYLYYKPNVCSVKHYL